VDISLDFDLLTAVTSLFTSKSVRKDRASPTRSSAPQTEGEKIQSAGKEGKRVREEGVVSDIGRLVWLLSLSETPSRPSLPPAPHRCCRSSMALMNAIAFLSGA